MALCWYVYPLYCQDPSRATLLPSLNLLCHWCCRMRWGSVCLQGWNPVQCSFGHVLGIQEVKAGFQLLRTNKQVFLQTRLKLMFSAVNNFLNKLCVWFQADSLSNASSLKQLTSPRKRIGDSDLQQKRFLNDGFSIDGTPYDSSISTVEIQSQETQLSKSGVEVTDDDLSKKDKTQPQNHDRAGFSLSESWKEDVSLGPLLASLIELFGDGILPFVPTTELNIFIWCGRLLKCFNRNIGDLKAFWRPVPDRLWRLPFLLDGKICLLFEQKPSINWLSKDATSIKRSSIYKLIIQGCHL